LYSAFFRPGVARMRRKNAEYMKRWDKSGYALVNWL
jgi:hypothetical protein